MPSFVLKSGSHSASRPDVTRSSIDIRTGGRAFVVGRVAMQLVLGGPPFRRKLDQAVRVVAELDRRGAKASAIMLDNDQRPDRVVVRMR